MTKDRMRLIRFIVPLVVVSSVLIVVQFHWSSIDYLQNRVNVQTRMYRAIEINSSAVENIRSIMSNTLVKGSSRPNTTKGFLTIGIPTVKRQKGASYLLSTISGLINKTKEEDRREITVLIFLADMDNSSRMHVHDEILGEFSSHVESGLIQIIQAPADYYPSLESLPKTYDHSKTKVKWRSKQNLDYAFMMLYSQDLSQYYLQLEDDVQTVPGYIDIIKEFISQQKQREWTCLEFSALGFIAKLYHSYDLEKLAKLLMLFFYEHPNDVTYLYFNQLKFQEHRIVRTPTIFKHLGLLSSLTEKLETRQDPLFEEVNSSPENETNIPNNFLLNPPAKLKSNFNIFSKFTPDLCYSGKTIMWALTPKQNQRLTIVFNHIQRIHDVKVVMGTSDHPDYFLQSAVLQVGQRITNGMCSGIIAAQSFKQGKALIEFGKTIQTLPIKCVQVLTLASQDINLQVVEISVRALTS